MKYVISLIILVLTLPSYSQIELPFNDDGKITYLGVLEDVNKTSEQLYLDTKEYILLNYESKGYPVLVDEKNKRIYVKGTFKVHFRKWYFPFFFRTKIYDEIYTLKIYFKDNRVKYEITDLFIQRKTNARISGYYWGYGVSTASIKESEVIKYDLEKLYIKRYRRKFYKLFQHTDKGIKSEIEALTKILIEENKMDDW